VIAEPHNICAVIYQKTSQSIPNASPSVRDGQRFPYRLHHEDQPIVGQRLGSFTLPIVALAMHAGPIALAMIGRVGHIDFRPTLRVSPVPSEVITASGG
jgi:hypothetical protein